MHLRSPISHFYGKILSISNPTISLLIVRGYIHNRLILLAYRLIVLLT